MANKVYSAPNVNITQKDFTFNVESVGITTLGMATETMKGPAFEPFYIKNFDVHETYFGGTSPELFKNTQIPKYEGAYIAKSYLGESNQMFLTRILGLSGYVASKAYVIRTLGAIDSQTLSGTSVTANINFYIDDSNVFRVTSDDSLLIDSVATTTGVDKSLFTAGFSNYFRTVNLPAPYEDDAMYWGTLPSAVEATVENGISSGGTLNDAYVRPSSVIEDDQEQHWLNTTFEFDSAEGCYNGTSFAMFVPEDSLGTNSSGQTSGTCRVITTSYTADPIAEYHNKLVATLRSRGAYVTDVLGYHVDSTITYDDFDNAANDPYAEFVITGSTTGSSSFEYTVSLDSDSTSYIKTVLGSGPKNGDAYLYVEEMYDHVLTKGYNEGKIKGLNPELLIIDDWDHYKFQFQTPATPFIVSELIGGIPQRLFRFIAVSDGESANFEVKVSIANVDLNKKTFDVYVRDFNDTDKNPVFLNRYFNCTMDPTSDNYVARKIGTSDGRYALNSAHVMLEMAENAPSTAVPAGFEGYEFRTSDGVGVPEIAYKTKYYSAGETMYNPPYLSVVTSNGDRVKKTYLGMGNLEGIDKDLLKFKGKAYSGTKSYDNGSDWTHKTKGFHLDINASLIVDSVTNELAFAVGEGTFTNAAVIAADTTHPYNALNTRKFTLCFAGGFDGWDPYRDSRTNTGDYRIGQTGFINGGFDTFVNAEFGETFGTSDYYAYLYASKLMSNKNDLSLSIFVTPAIDIINNTDLITEIVEMVEEDRGDCIYIPTIPDIKLLNNTNPNNTDNWYYPEDLVEQLEDTDIDTQYAGVFYPWQLYNDTVNNAKIFLPPTYDVVRNLALTDNRWDPWWATGGYDRGLMNSERSRIKLTQPHIDTLYEGRINPIVMFSDSPVPLIWGNRNLSTVDSAANRLNTRRLMNQLQVLITDVSKRLLFDQNDELIRQQFLSLVNPILDEVRKNRGIFGYEIKLDTDSSTENLDTNTLSGKIRIKPVRTLEYVDLEFGLTPNSVSFG